MSVIEVLAAARDLGRLQEIVGTLLRHGLGDVVQRLGMLRPLERAGRVLHWSRLQNLREMATEARVRLALEELGPTFVKFGQLLASRPDLLPATWIAELGQLRQRVTPVDFEELWPDLCADLGAEPDQVFRDLERTSLAAGSIAQVHRARLPSGEAVVLKIRRPGIRAVVEADLRLLERLAEHAAEQLPELRRYRPTTLVRVFARQLRDELDFTHEARNTARLAEQLADDPHVHLPRVFERFTRERLLVLALVEGVSAEEFTAGVRPPDLDPRLLARRGAQALLRMIFVHGHYHADPHPGNLFFGPGSTLTLIDCGMVGHLSARRREEFLGLLVAVFERDERQVTEALLGWAADDQAVDRELLGYEVRSFIDRYHGATLEQVDLSQVLSSISEVVRDNGLFLPTDVSSLIRVFTLVDALGRGLDPQFDLTALAGPLAQNAIREHRSPTRLLNRQLTEISRLLQALPRDSRLLLDRAKRGRLGFEIHHPDLPEFAARVNESANRIAVGLLAAALIVGTAIATTVEGGPRLWGMPVLGLFGFVGSVTVGTLLLWSILRSGRR
jgi:ubiquinone biosynthesis protein